MARPPKGKPLTLRPIRLDDDVWAECQRLGKEHGTINEGLRAQILKPPPVRINISELSGVPNYDPRTGKLLSGKPFKFPPKRGPRPKGDKNR